MTLSRLRLVQHYADSIHKTLLRFKMGQTDKVKWLNSRQRIALSQVNLLFKMKVKGLIVTWVQLEQSLLIDLMMQLKNINRVIPSFNTYQPQVSEIKFNMHLRNIGERLCKFWSKGSVFNRYKRLYSAKFFKTRTAEKIFKK